MESTAAACFPACLPACLPFSTATNIITVYEYQGSFQHDAQSSIKGQRQLLKDEISLLQSANRRVLEVTFDANYGGFSCQSQEASEHYEPKHSVTSVACDGVK